MPSLKRLFTLFFILSAISLPGQNPAVDLLMHKEQELGPAPGISWAVISRDSTLSLGAAGKTGISQAPLMHPDMPLRIGSVSKTIIALAIMRQVQDKLYDLEDPLSELLPELECRNSWEATSPLTVAHLLEHSSGFDDMHPNERCPIPCENPTLLEALERRPRARRSRWRPGTRISYSNVNYAILAYLLEAKSGKTWQEVVAEEVLVPLNMKATTFQRPEDFSTGHLGSPVRLSKDYNYSLSPALGLWSTARDMGLLLRLFLNKGRMPNGVFLRRDLMNRMQRSHTTTAAKDGFSYGRTPGLERFFHRGLRGFGHEGEVPGYRALFRYLPDAGCGYVILSNHEDGWTGRMEQGLRRMLLRRMAMGTPPGFQLSEMQKDRITGYYLHQNPRTEAFHFADTKRGDVELYFSGDTLLLETYSSEEFRFLAVDEKSFRLMGGVEPILFLGNQEDGQPYLQVKEKYYEPGNAFFNRTIRYFLPRVESYFLIFLIYAVLHFVLWLLRRITFTRLTAATVISALPYIFMNLGMLLYFQVGPESVGTLSLIGVGLFLLSLMIPFFAAWGFYLSITAWRVGYAREFLFFSVLASVLNLALTAYLFSYGMIGYTMW